MVRNNQKNQQAAATGSSLPLPAFLKPYQDQFESLIERPGPIHEILAIIERKTQVKKVYIAYGKFLDITF